MILLIETGAFRVMCKHVELKFNTYYYRRRLPKDVRELYVNPRTKKQEIQLYFSLKTQDKAQACQRADAKTRQLDTLWKSHRDGYGVTANSVVSVGTLAAAGLKQGDGMLHPDNPVLEDFVDRLVGGREPHEPAQRLSAQDEMTIKILYGAPIPKILSDAKEIHFALGKGPKGPVAEKQFDRAWRIVLEVAGDIPVEQLRRSHANDFVDRLIKRGSGAETIKRYLSQVRPVISTAIREFELSCNNRFDSITIPNAGEHPRKPRDTYSMLELEAVQKQCRKVDDQRRWAILMISDTMARLAEIVGLTKDEVHLNHPFPRIDLLVTDNRGLKTKRSERKIPLVGEALWAAQKAISTPGPFLFPIFAPKYPRTTVASNAASAALNKWLKENGLARRGQSLHSFRHTMRDRLRNEGVPADLIDRIGGWKTAGVGEGYGMGHSLEVMQRAMLKTVRLVSG